MFGKFTAGKPSHIAKSSPLCKNQFTRVFSAFLFHGKTKLLSGHQVSFALGIADFI
jgi:hypothetical protein